jgi:hypothetical protein
MSGHASKPKKLLQAPEKMGGKAAFITSTRCKKNV